MSSSTNPVYKNSSTLDWMAEVASRSRFEFGGNWAKFLASLEDWQVEESAKSLSDFIGTKSLKGKRFLDVGCGSGLSSLAAARLGAEVTSFDYDPIAVSCAMDLKARFRPRDRNWSILQGSVLDENFLEGLGEFDYVYSWGVLHHTGDLWLSLENVITKLNQPDCVFVAVYNHQRYGTPYWKVVKRTFVRHPIARLPLMALHLIYPGIPSWVIRKMENRKSERGMSFIRDMVDWLGGYPFETARPETVVMKFREHGYSLVNLKTVGGRSGCNEFLFSIQSDAGD